jgi:tetratricopeptide (TPR) repeat protein
VIYERGCWKRQRRLSKTLKLPHGLLKPWITSAMCIKMGMPEKAIEIYNKAINIDPDFASAHWNLAWPMKAKR